MYPDHEHISGRESGTCTRAEFWIRKHAPKAVRFRLRKRLKEEVASVDEDIYIGRYFRRSIVTLTTRVSSAKRGTKSLKTTIPEGVVEFLGLTDRCELEWNMVALGYDRSVSARKIASRTAYEDHLDAPDFYSQSVAHNSPCPSSHRGSIHHHIREEKAKNLNGSSDQRLFNESKAFSGRDVGSNSPKIEAIRRYATPFFPADELDEKLRTLSESFLSGAVSETYLDECLANVRTMANMMEALKPSASDKSKTEKDDFRLRHRHTHLMQIPDVTRLKLEKIERGLESHYEAPGAWQIVETLIDECHKRGNDAFLEDAFEHYKRKAKNEETRRSS